MLSTQQPSSNTSSPRSPQHVLQHLKSSFSIPGDSLHPYSTPESPIQPSPRKIINRSPIGQALSPFSNSGLLLPLRMRTENNDNQRPDLFNMRSQTEASDSEDYLIGQAENNENIKEKGINKNAQTLVDDIKNRKKAQSAKKSYKCSSPISKSEGLWSKENIDVSMSVIEEDANSLQKKYRSSVEKGSRSVGGEAKFKSEKKELKPALVDLDVDMGIDENLQEDGVEGLFDEGYMDKERLLKELGSIRYSKMSEEDAATIFEIRRKEVLSFLKKLGSNSVAKKKSHKYPALIRSSITSNNGQSSDAEKIDFPSGKALRCLQESVKDNASPTRFIIYNTANESLWNNNNNSQTNKCVTPAKEKKLALSMRIGCESAPDSKRRDSSKILREKEEPNPLVERNLEVNFNHLFEWSDAAEKRTPIKASKKAEPAIISNYDDKNDDTESIIINLTKASRLKKNKATKRNGDKTEKSSLSSSQKIVITKQLSEDIRLSPLWEQQEIQVENRANQKAIEELRKKNQAVMNEIDEIDDQIQRMQESDNQETQFQRKPINNKEEHHKIFIEENLQEGYSVAAKMKKTSERSRSLSLKLGFKENLQRNENPSGGKGKTGQNSRRNIAEESGSQSRRNEKSRVENSEEIKRGNAPTPIKLSNEKVLPSATVQTTTLKFDLTKQNTIKNNRGHTPVIKQTLSKNTNGSKSGLHDMKFETAKECSSLQQVFNSSLKTSPPTANRILEKNKLNNKPICVNNRISKTSETTSTLQTVREHLLTSPKETVTLRRTNSKLKSESLCKREPSSCSIPSNKASVQPQKPPNKSLSIKISQKAVSDKCIAEVTLIPNLFENNCDTNIREPSTPAPKIPFSREIKTSSQEAPQEKTPVLSAVKQKPTVQKSETPKTIQKTPIKVKKGEVNRPTFDTSSSAGIRAKIFGRKTQESSVYIKPILSPKIFSNTSRLDPSQVSPQGTLSSNSGNITETLRKGSLSTPRGFKLLSSPVSQSRSITQSLQDLRENLAGKQGAGSSEEMESLESFRLREKSLNLPLRPVKSLSQAENTKMHEAKKDTQAFKRKPATGYSLC